MKSLYAPLVLLLAVIQITVAQSQTWTGNQDSDWNNAANWSDWPLDGEDITIDPASYTGTQASPEITTNSVFSPAEMAIQNGGTLIIAAELSTEDDVEVIGAGSGITVNDGNFSVNFTDGGRLIFELGSYLVVEGGTVNVGERLIIGEDAVVTINNGEANSGERWLMDGGGMCIQNGGTVTAGQVFAIGDGSVNNSSAYELHGGTLNITGEMAFENEVGIFEPTFLMTGGDLFVTGDIVWFGEEPGGGTPRFIMSGGTAIINGNLLNSLLSTVNMFLQIEGDAAFNLSNGIVEQSTTNDSIMQSGTSQITLENVANVNIAGTYYATGGETVITAPTNLIGFGSVQFNNLFIGTGGSFTHQAPPMIQMYGDLNALGSFTPMMNAVEFNGSTSQEILTGSMITFHEVVLSNSSPGGLTLLSPVEVNGHLQLNDGVINTTDVNTLTILDNATSNMGGTETYVNGPLTKVGNEAYVFPIGKNDQWNRLSISPPSNETVEFTAQYFNDAYDSTDPVNDPLDSVSENEYWSLETDSPEEEVSVGLFWEDPIFSDIDCGNVTMARWNDSSWDQVPSNSTGDCFGNNSGNVTSQSLISDFGILTFGYFAPVGLADEDSILFQTYPNPTTGEMTVALNHPVPELSIQLMDLSGNHILDRSFNVAHQLSIDLSDQPSGVYLLRLVSERSVSTHKVVKR